MLGTLGTLVRRKFGRIKKPEIHQAWDLKQKIINQVIKDVFGKVNGYMFSQLFEFHRGFQFSCEL